MAAGGFFTKLSNEVLEATERISARLEEGLSVLLDGELPKEDSAAPVDHEALHSEEDAFESPLPGIADGVLDDIMSSQVRSPARCSIRTVTRYWNGKSTFQLTFYSFSFQRNVRLARKHQRNTCMLFSRPSHGQNPLFCLSWHSKP